MSSPTPQQLEAINYDGGNLLIVACAGSGKTDTISRRIARLVRDGARKNSIIAFTFTNHAANELKARVRKYLEEEVPHEPSLGDMYVGTIHSFCLRLLKERYPQYRNYEVMDEVRQAALISANFTRFDDSNRGIGLDRLRSQTRSKTYWETVRRFTTTLNIVHQQSIRTDQIPNALLRDAIERYETLAYETPNYFFDFNRVIDELMRRLRSDVEALGDVREGFSHLIVDEYQDVDDRQEELISLLTDRGRAVTVTAVGDDDQALYGFRGASVHNILTFQERYPSVHRVDMGANFRCTHAIVEIADQAIRQVSARLPKAMVARRREPLTDEIVERMAEPGDIRMRTFADEEEEAQWVASRILELRGVEFEEKDGNTRALDYADMAILLRSVKSAGTVFAHALRERGIPVVVNGTRGLFNNDEIRVVQAAFCLLARADLAVPDDEGKLQILNTLDTREFIRKSISRLRVLQIPTADAGRFLGWIGSKLEELDRRSLAKEQRGPRLAKRIYPQDIFQEILRELGSQEGKWTPDTLFNFGAFSSLLAEFEAVHQWITPANLKGLCLFLGNWAASNVDEGGLDEVVRLNSVQIMTVHAAKGLEWPVVFLPRISSSNFPSSRRSHGPETFLPESLFDPKTYAGGDDGERRLWYVALTRCAKFLNVSSLDRPGKRPTKYWDDIHHNVVRHDDSDPTFRSRGNPRPPEDAVLLPTTFSDLSYWWRCPFEYQLRSLMGFSPGVGEQYGYGQQLHNILAEIHDEARNGHIFEPDEVEELVTRRFHLRYTQKGPLEALRTAATRSLVRYVKDSLPALTQTQAVEKPFEFIDRESGAVITGTVDLLEQVEEHEKTDPHRQAVGIVDFKAHRIKTQDEWERFLESAERQLRLYASAVRYAFPYEPARGIVQLITPEAQEINGVAIPDRTPVDVSETHRTAAMLKVRTAISDIRTGLESQNFSCDGAQNGWCRRCDFKKFCPGFPLFRKLNPSASEPPGPVEEREAEVDQVMEEQNARP
ncbi:MAG: ATP-dependent helicase [Proteobacteria bacterium]|nr:ATP-dependent helicase [Pseudomonadota bacterium]